MWVRTANIEPQDCVITVKYIKRQELKCYKQILIYFCGKQHCGIF